MPAKHSDTRQDVGLRKHSTVKSLSHINMAIVQTHPWAYRYHFLLDRILWTRRWDSSQDTCPPTQRHSCVCFLPPSLFQKKAGLELPTTETSHCWHCLYCGVGRTQPCGGETTLPHPSLVHLWGLITDWLTGHQFPSSMDCVCMHRDMNQDESKQSNCVSFYMHTKQFLFCMHEWWVYYS